MSYTKDIIQPTNTLMAGDENCLLGREKKLFSEPPQQTPCLSGENLKTTLDKPELTALSSATKALTKAANSFDKRTQLLMRSGLIAGITPLSIRKRLRQQIPASVSLPQGGVGCPAELKNEG